MKSRLFATLMGVCLTPFIMASETFYLSPAGNDNNDGSIENPWASFAPALEAVQAGDTLYLRQGVYALKEQLDWQNSGAPDAWITISGYPEETAVIDAGAIESLGTHHVLGAFHVEGPSYLRLENFLLQNSRGMGIAVFGPSEHVIVENCRVHQTFGPAIGCWNASEIKVLRCEVTAANARIMSPRGWRQREAPHEAISIAGVNGFEVAYNHVHHCEKEGIDVKEVSVNGSVHHNLVHDLDRQGLYVDAWFGLLENVEFYKNTVFRCEWGMVMSVEDDDSELRNVRIHQNLIFANRGSGIFFGRWGNDGPRSDIKIYHNTLVHNGSAHHWAGATGNIDVRSPNIRDVEIYGNLCVASEATAFQIATFADPAIEADVFTARDIRIHGNVVDAWEGRAKQGREGYGWMYPFHGDDLVIGDPDFVDVDVGDYRLGPDSAALGAAPNGADAGAIPAGSAFEYMRWPTTGPG